MNTRKRAIQQLEEAERYCEKHGLTGMPRLGRMLALVTGHLVERDAEQDFPAVACGQRRVVLARNGVPVAIDYLHSGGRLEDVCHVWLRGGTDILVLLGCEAILRWAEEAATADAARMANASTVAAGLHAEASSSVKPVAVVLENLDGNEARIRYMFNPVPVGAELQWDHNDLGSVLAEVEARDAAASSLDDMRTVVVTELSATEAVRLEGVPA